RRDNGRLILYGEAFQGLEASIWQKINKTRLNTRFGYRLSRILLPSKATRKCQSTTYGTIAYIFYGNMNAQTDISKKFETSWRLNPTIILPTPRYKHKFIMFHLLTRWTLMIYSK